ncbi:hypothetical protein GOBAR_DD30413 [Gossypium barbadense]|nr:hypothetical protein GOBAR_DD30413 [Gossypium barbadense]
MMVVANVSLYFPFNDICMGILANRWIGKTDGRRQQSLPNSLIRNLTCNGIGGYLDLFEKWREEELAMERVESRRDLRAKLFEKLSKENCLERTNPGQGSGDPIWTGFRTW